MTACLIQKSLAVDNIFVVLIFFTCFAVPPAFRKRVLMSGVVGIICAIVRRTVMILLGGWIVAAGAVSLGAASLGRFPEPHRCVKDVAGRWQGAADGSRPLS